METYTGVLFNEDINSGLINSQFIKPLQTLKENGYDVNIIYICKPGKNVDADIDINIKRIPLAIPYSLFLYGRLSLILVPVMSVIYSLLFYFIVNKDSNYIVRGYFPSFTFSLLKRFNSSVNYTFDPRSLFIDESMVSKKIPRNGFILNMWRVIERNTLNYATNVICVSSKQQEFYSSISKAVCILVPCYSDLHTRTFNSRSNLPSMIENIEEKIVIGYFGSLDSGWNNVDNYAEFMSKNSSSLHYVIISQNFDELSKDKRFCASNITLIGDVSMKDKLSLLNACDYGLFLMSKNPDWETRLGVKFADYVSLGLPVIISPYVGEAVKYISKYSLPNSIVLDEDGIIKESILVKNNRRIREIYSTYASKLFSYNNILKITRNKDSDSNEV